LIFAIVVLVAFGPKRLPEMGRMLGKGMREFKDGITHHHEALDDSPKSPSLPSGVREQDSI
jgi:sec-independent protein translocase protein TatA